MANAMIDAKLPMYDMFQGIPKQWDATPTSTRSVNWQVQHAQPAIAQGSTAKAPMKQVVSGSS
jgi:hypothetical protein